MLLPRQRLQKLCTSHLSDQCLVYMLLRRHVRNDAGRGTAPGEGTGSRTDTSRLFAQLSQSESRSAEHFSRPRPEAGAQHIYRARSVQCGAPVTH